jgi:hypothetical protein
MNTLSTLCLSLIQTDMSAGVTIPVQLPGEIPFLLHCRTALRRDPINGPPRPARSPDVEHLASLAARRTTRDSVHTTHRLRANQPSGQSPGRGRPPPRSLAPEFRIGRTSVAGPLQGSHPCTLHDESPASYFIVIISHVNIISKKHKHRVCILQSISPANPRRSSDWNFAMSAARGSEDCHRRAGTRFSFRPFKIRTLTAAIDGSNVHRKSPCFFSGTHQSRNGGIRPGKCRTTSGRIRRRFRQRMRSPEQLTLKPRYR